MCEGECVKPSRLVCVNGNCIRTAFVCDKGPKKKIGVKGDSDWMTWVTFQTPTVALTHAFENLIFWNVPENLGNSAPDRNSKFETHFKKGAPSTGGMGDTHPRSCFQIGMPKWKRDLGTKRDCSFEVQDYNKCMYLTLNEFVFQLLIIV